MSVLNLLSGGLNGSPMGILAILAGVLSIAALTAAIYITFFYIDLPKIRNLPEIPGGGILSGHLYALGNDHATTAQQWSTKYGWPVFQFRMGYRRAVMINSFEDARQWLVKNQSSTVDRPWFYTFHGIVSKTSAATIGTSPWNERTKKQRRVVGSFTTGPAMKRMANMIDMETAAAIAGLYYDGKKGTQDLEPHVYQKRLALNFMMMLCYGTRFTSVQDPMLLRILVDAKTIASFRSTNSNPQDFIPHLRYLGGDGRTSTATEVRDRRDTWLARMLENVQKNLNKLRPGDKKCVAEMLLEDNAEGLTELDVKTILGGLMSGGFETLYSTAIITTGQLSTSHGQTVQDRAYEDLITTYGSAQAAFKQCVLEEKSPYVQGLVKEALRFYPPLKLLPARQVYKDFEFRGATIPKGLLFYVNTQAANFDKSVYGPDADAFKPERWVSGAEIPAPYHFAYGAGGRMCTAVNFANRLLYVTFVRMIIGFRVSEGDAASKPNIHYIDYKDDPAASNAIPLPFKVRFVPRDVETLEACLKESSEGLAEFVEAEPLIR